MVNCETSEIVADKLAVRQLTLKSEAIGETSL